jgi:hypothetical protein
LLLRRDPGTESRARRWALMLKALARRMEIEHLFAGPEAAGVPRHEA